MKKRLPASLLIGLSVLASACNMATSYHLVADSDVYKATVTADALPADWQKNTFDDSKWSDAANQVGPLQQSADGSMPNVAARRHFDIGAQAGSYTSFTLTVSTSGSWTAYLNGQQVAVSGATASAATTFSVPAGL